MHRILRTTFASKPWPNGTMCRYKKKIYDLVKEHVDSADDIAEVCPHPLRILQSNGDTVFCWCQCHQFVKLREFQYRMPEAYDMGEGVNQEKRFSVAMQRYKYVLHEAFCMMLDV